MGLNTAVVVLNDYMHRLEDDPTFSQEIADAIRENGRSPHGYNGFGVLPSVHADYEQVVVVGGNMIKRFDQLPKEKAEHLLRVLAESLDMKVSRRGAKPT